MTTVYHSMAWKRTSVFTGIDGGLSPVRNPCLGLADVRCLLTSVPNWCWAAGHVLAGWESIGAKFEVMAAGDPVLDAPTS